MKAGVTVVGTLIQYGGDRRNAWSSASFTIRLSSYLYDHGSFAPSGTGILQKGRQSERVYPLIHAFTALRGKVVSPHVRVLSLEGELPVDLVFGSANGNPIRRQEYRTQEFLFLWTFVIEKTIFRQDEPAFLPKHESFGALLV